MRILKNETIIDVRHINKNNNTVYLAEIEWKKGKPYFVRITRKDGKDMTFQEVMGEIQDCNPNYFNAHYKRV